VVHDEDALWAFITKAVTRDELKDFTSIEDFMQYHQTGSIPFGAYEQYRTLEGISWLGTKERYPTLLSMMKVNGELIEIRAEVSEARYVKHDKDRNIVRDERGDAIMLTPEEAAAKGLCSHQFSIAAFNERGQPVGWASDEFGTDGIWVAEEYQNKGIGSELLYTFRRFYPPKRRMGQMTYSGCKLAEAYYRRLEKEKGLG